MIEVTKTEKDFTEYVQSMISKFSKNAQLIVDGEVSPKDLNRALAEYQSLNIALIGMYQKVKIEKSMAEIEYQKWYDNSFIKARNELNEDLESKKIKISVTEIETLVRNKNEKDYYEWQNSKILLEHKEAFILRLVEQFKKWDSILIAISNNMRQEMRTLDIYSKLDSDHKVSERKIRNRID